MAVRRILRMGHPHLRRRAQPVPLDWLGSAACARLLQDMEDTLKDYGGVGLAAPQIDEDLRVAIIEIDTQRSTRYGEQMAVPLTVFVNPVIEVLPAANEAGFWEGCLSVPGLRGWVQRPQQVRVHYTDRVGEQQTAELHGFPATVVQHEFDHLDGTLYVDRVSAPELLMFEQELERHRDTWNQFAQRRNS